MTKIWATHPGSKVLGHLDVFLSFPSSAHDEDWVVPRTLKCEMGCPLKPGREAQPGSIRCRMGSSAWSVALGLWSVRSWSLCCWLFTVNLTGSRLLVRPGHLARFSIVLVLMLNFILFYLVF